MNKIISSIGLLILSLMPLTSKAAATEDSNPLAAPAAVVLSGHARFTVLTPQMIRVQYSDKGLFEDRATFAVVNRRLPVPRFTVSEKDGYLFIKTSAMTLRYRKNAPLTKAEHNGDNLQITFMMNGQQVKWYPGKDNILNLKGTTRTLDGAIGDNKRSELENGLLSRAGWVVVDESPMTKRGDGSTTFALDKKVNGMPWVAEPVDKSAIDWYFMGYGHDYKKALGDYIKIGGREPMPPKFVFGYWYSRWWAYSQDDYKDLVNTMQSKDIPLDVMIMDMEWHTKGWTGWTWNKKLIPDPHGLLSWMHNHNLEVALNLHPADGVNSDQDGFTKLREDLHLPATTKNIPWRLEDSTFYKNMFKDIIHPLGDYGVDFWWLDWQQNLLNKHLSGLSETFWINHVFYNDMRYNKPSLRPLIFHRWGGLGSHRYPIGFSGDAVIDYSTLDFETYFTPTASNVCFGYWGHDLGGHQRAGSKDLPNDPQLYLRWLQFGVFTPIFRTHATIDPAIERRIWEFPNFNDLRKMVVLRYQMVPYIYTAARQAYDTGVSICRPMYYDYPENDEAYSYENEYMFGDNILVAPVVSPVDSNGLAHRKVWLPKGQWFDVCKNTLENGSKVFTGNYTLTQIPVFLKAGSIIPCYNDSVRNLKKQCGDIVLYVVPGANGKGWLYEDNGNNEDYKTGAFASTVFTQTRQNNKILLTIEPTKGQYKGMLDSHNYTFKVLGETHKPLAVSFNNKKLNENDGWTYDAATHTLTIKLASLGIKEKAIVDIARSMQR